MTTRKDSRINDLVRIKEAYDACLGLIAARQEFFYAARFCGLDSSQEVIWHSRFTEKTALEFFEVGKSLYNKKEAAVIALPDDVECVLVQVSTASSDKDYPTSDGCYHTNAISFATILLDDIEQHFFFSNNSARGTFGWEGNYSREIASYLLQTDLVALRDHFPKDQMDDDAIRTNAFHSQLRTEYMRARYLVSQNGLMHGEDTDDTPQPKKPQPEEAHPEPPQPAWQRLALSKQYEGSDIATLDGLPHRVSRSAFDMLHVLKGKQGNMVLGDTITIKCGSRPDCIYKRLPPAIQAIIDKPGRGNSGYKMS